MGQSATPTRDFENRKISRRVETHSDKPDLVETDLFAAILIIQSLPFFSAVATEVLELFGEAGNNKRDLLC